MGAVEKSPGLAFWSRVAATVVSWPRMGTVGLFGGGPKMPWPSSRFFQGCLEAAGLQLCGPAGVLVEWSKPSSSTLEHFG